MPDGWDYRTLEVNVTNGHVPEAILDEQLTELGREGWELLSVTPLVVDGMTVSLLHHFRRNEERTRKAGFQP